MLLRSSPRRFPACSSSLLVTTTTWSLPPSPCRLPLLLLPELGFSPPALRLLFSLLLLGSSTLRPPFTTSSLPRSDPSPSGVSSPATRSPSRVALSGSSTNPTSICSSKHSENSIDQLLQVSSVIDGCSEWACWLTKRKKPSILSSCRWLVGWSKKISGPVLACSISFVDDDDAEAVDSCVPW
ncbi:hypothetical protein FN846DRAFT_974022 [Sphaerosporella brunnea]|uniref:Uncharacterized protein n=1 Tax=Sphaerosporella brunnea TaxID=1250544 RepID=A0A5J5EFG6_9PEZI|nr:hypothetical protein FN846DRAFT_974022 [Sphaerosporella brunnea]